MFNFGLPELIIVFGILLLIFVGAKFFKKLGSKFKLPKVIKPAIKKPSDLQNSSN